MKILFAADFSGILHVRPQNSSCKARSESDDCKMENNAAVLRRGCMMPANWSSGWLVDV